VKPLWIKLLAGLGCALIIAGVSILAMGSYTVYAQDEQADFVGAKECASCHRTLARDHDKSNHALALQDVSKKKTGILGDFDQGEDVRTVQFPKEDKPRAFTAKDITFAIGAGRHVQRYLYKVGANNYMVLPAEWNVEKKVWEPLKLADKWPSDAYDWEQNCAACHTTGYNAERGRWEDAGVQCEACHGPASIHVERAKDAGRNPSDEELASIRSAIYTAPDPQVCGQCHAQGTGPDNHPYPVGYVPGKDLSQFFTLVAKDSGDHWWVSGHAKQKYMQYNEWLDSSHATALTDMLKSSDAADSCLTCHSQDARQNAAQIAAVKSGDRDGQPPEAVTTASAKWGVTCTTCHYPHTDSKQPSDLVGEANELCMSCHTNPTDKKGIHHPVTEMFQGVTLVEGIDGVPGAHFSAKDGPLCMTCHMQLLPVDAGSRISHRFTPVLPGQANDQLPSACSGCHQEQTATDMQFLVDDTQTAVRSRLSAALEKLKGITAPPADSARYQQAAAALTFVQNDGSLGIHNFAYADALLNAAERDIALLSGLEATAEATATPAPTTIPDSLANQPFSGEPVASGVRPVTIFVIGAVIAILVIATIVFFRHPGDQEG
jgi:predicted CXXCH cytochrome family protein